MSRGDSGRSGSHSSGRGSKGGNKGNSRNSRTSKSMTVERARAIQEHADKTGRNQDFKSRAMSAADKNEKK